MRRRSERHQPDLVDAAIQTHALSPSTVAAATYWLTGEEADTAVDGPTIVREQPITIRTDAWAKVAARTGMTLPVDGVLRRRSLYELADTALHTGNWLPTLTATCAWGQGSNGYGPRRLTDMLDAAPDLNNRLANTAEHLVSDGPVTAYRYLAGAGHVPGFGPAFFTKFLHVADQEPRSALILDKVVATALRPFVIEALTQAGTELHLPARREAEWLFGDTGWSPHRYGVYLTWAARMLIQLNEVDQRWGTDPAVVELALFKGKLTPTSATP